MVRSRKILGTASARWATPRRRLVVLFAVVGMVLGSLANLTTAGAQPKVLDGTLVVVAAHRHHGGSVEQYFLERPDGWYPLVLHRQLSLPPNARVTVAGTLRNRSIDVATINAVPAVAPMTATTGDQTVLVIPVYWSSADSNTSDDFADQISADSAYYNENSYGMLSSLTPTVTPWLQIPAPPSSDCDDLGSIRLATIAATRIAGYDPSSYTHDMIYISGHDCSGSSWGQIGGRWTWIQGRLDNYRTMHELGHNLGLSHAHSLYCTRAGRTAVPVSDSCTSSEYGDLFDDMGLPLSGDTAANYFNASQKNLLGWFGSRARAVTTSGTFSLAPFGQQTPGLQALEITTPNRTYWIEGRQQLGGDSDLPSGAVDGALVHITQPGNGSWLIDMTPGTPGGFGDAALPVGQTWSDPEGVFALKVNSDGPSGLNVTITMGGATGPVVQIPSTEFAFPAVLGTSSIPVREIWAKASDPNGICGYELRQSVNGGPFNEVTLPTPKSTSVALSLNPSTTYSFELRATNCLGQSSAWAVQPSFSPLVWQESSNNVKYTGTWAAQSVGSAYGGALKYSTSKNATVSETVQGTGVAWVSETGPTFGKATVFIDGLAVKTVNLFTATLQPRQIVWKQEWSTKTTRTIKIVVKGTAGHPRVDLDAILALHLE